MSADKVIKPSAFFYRLTQIVLYRFYRICFDFRFYGAENVPEDGRGVILAPNHASYLDPPMIGISLKKPIHYLAKDYLFKVFALRRMIFWLGSLPIKSEGDDFRSMRLILRALKDGKRLVIFPEGTRTLDGNFKDVEAGAGFLAVKSHSHVVPVYIEGSFAAFPKGVKWFRCKPIRVYYGKPFIPSEDAELMAKEDPYLAVSQKIMAEIKSIKENTKIFAGPGKK